MKSLASVAIWNLINEGQSNGGCLVVEARDDGTGNSSLGGSSIIRSNNVSTCWVVHGFLQPLLGQLLQT